MNDPNQGVGSLLLASTRGRLRLRCAPVLSRRVGSGMERVAALAWRWQAAAAGGCFAGKAPLR
ncbi:hypothetical protein CBM2587_B50074 [Cupriavidus taiwanensis]|uniref:Uncharacterized protein n=1 Tax=Cupriavidus taiwanensis TaxID=164546 RepID=A0A976A5S2_9BURK|nr:hypothetical protein CBM2587_B50074 [Cupriavidus taiwanensis]